MAYTGAQTTWLYPHTSKGGVVRGIISFKFLNSQVGQAFLTNATATQPLPPSIAQFHKLRVCASLSPHAANASHHSSGEVLSGGSTSERTSHTSYVPTTRSFHQLRPTLLSSPDKLLRRWPQALSRRRLPAAPVHLNPVRIIPKPHQLATFRLIVDLLAPHGANMSYAIPPELSFLQYPRVDQAAVFIAQHGRGALIAKLNLHSA